MLFPPSATEYESCWMKSALSAPFQKASLLASMLPAAAEELEAAMGEGGLALLQATLQATAWMLK